MPPPTPLCTAPPQSCYSSPRIPPSRAPHSSGVGAQNSFCCSGLAMGSQDGEYGGEKGGGMFSMGSPPPEICCPQLGRGGGGGCACCVRGATALCLGRGQLWLYPPLLPAGLFWEGGDPNLLRPRAVLCLGGEGGGQSRSRVSGRGSWLLSAPSPPPPKAGGRTGPCSSPPPL